MTAPNGAEIELAQRLAGGLLCHRLDDPADLVVPVRAQRKRELANAILKWWHGSWEEPTLVESCLEIVSEWLDLEDRRTNETERTEGVRRGLRKAVHTIQCCTIRSLKGEI